AEIEQGLGQDPFRTEDESDQQAADAAVAVEEWVDGLELDMGQGRLDQRGGSAGLVVQEFLEIADARLHLLRGGRHEEGIAGARPPGPVLGAPVLPWGLLAA